MCPSVAAITEMDETRSGVCEVEKVPRIEVHGDESDNSSTGLGDESLSASENIFVDSRSDNSMSSEHGREANINMDIDNDYERNICEVVFEENSNEEISGLENLYDYYGESDMESGFFDESVGGKHSGESKPSNNTEAHVDDGDDANLSHACQAEDMMDLYMMIKEMTFPCEEAAFVFYNSYAKDNGFSIRLDKMKCPICGNRDGGCHMKLKEPKFFCITLRTNYEEYSNIHCYVRKYINKSTGNALTVESGDRGVYNFLLDKMKKKTRIFGPDYNKFITDYDMHQNEKIRFDIIEEEENVFVIALDIEDYSKELFKEVFDFEGDAKSIFISKTVELKNSEIININSRVYDRGLGLSGVFVHRLSTYDVASNALCIPKTIVSFLDVRRTGHIYFLRGEDDDDSHAVYYTAVDGRIRFKSGWRDFCVKNNLVAGQLVLCLFFKMEGMLFMSVDVIE
ncbi:hypothetical protein ACQ4PT_024938 [Festuca glaucescens]